MSTQVLREILGMFVNTLKPMASILFKVVRIGNSQFKWNYLKNENRVNVLPKLKTVKIFVTKLFQEQRFRMGFGRQHVKSSQLLAKSRWEHIFIMFFYDSQRGSLGMFMFKC